MDLSAGTYLVVPSAGVWFLPNRGAVVSPAIWCTPIPSGTVRTYLDDSHTCPTALHVACDGGAVIPCGAAVTLPCEGV